VDADSQTVQLGVQLAVSAALVLAMTIIHSLGLMGTAKLLPIEEDRLEQRAFDWRAVMLLGNLGLVLFLLHIAEIWLFAAFYLAVGAMQTLEEALYYSASAYATLGRTADYFPNEWRLIGAVEALIGFVLISWSTAFMATSMNKLRR
jgi:hypothetical protein